MVFQLEMRYSRQFTQTTEKLCLLPRQQELFGKGGMAIDECNSRSKQR